MGSSPLSIVRTEYNYNKLEMNNSVASLKAHLRCCCIATPRLDDDRLEIDANRSPLKNRPTRTKATKVAPSPKSRDVRTSGRSPVRQIGRSPLGTNGAEESIDANESHEGGSPAKLENRTNPRLNREPSEPSLASILPTTCMIGYWCDVTARYCFYSASKRLLPSGTRDHRPEMTPLWHRF